MISPLTKFKQWEFHRKSCSFNILTHSTQSSEDQCLALFLKQIYNEWSLIQRLKANIIKIIQGLPNYLLHKFNLSVNSFPQSSRVMTAVIDVYFYGPTKLHFA